MASDELYVGLWLNCFLSFVTRLTMGDSFDFDLEEGVEKNNAIKARAL